MKKEKRERNKYILHIDNSYKPYFYPNFMAEQEKPRILYIDKKYEGLSSMHHSESSRTRNERIRRILEIQSELEKHFSVDLQTDLNAKLIPLISEDIYDGMVSHFPWDRSIDFKSQESLELSKKGKLLEKLYGTSSDIISKIRQQNPRLPILIYTGAYDADCRPEITSDMDQIIMETGANDIIYKSRDGHNDGRIIVNKLLKIMRISIKL